MKSFGTILKNCRNTQGLSQKELANQMLSHGFDVSHKTISKWESNTTLPNVLQFFTLCEILNINDINNTFQLNTRTNPFFSLNQEGQEKALDYINLLKLSGIYNKPIADVMPFRRKLRFYDLPVSAGTGQFLDSDNYQEIEVGDEVSSYADFGVRISGDSMEPQFVNGQTIWIHQQKTLDTGEIGIFFYDGQAYCKKFIQTEDGIQLHSLNPNYAPIIIKPYNDFMIFGKVVG